MCEGQWTQKSQCFGCPLFELWAEVHTHTHTHRYSQFSAHVVKKNEKKKKGNRRDTGSSYLATSFSFSIKLYCLSSHLHLKRGTELSARWHVAMIPTTSPLSLASSLPLFSIRPPDWCTKGRVWPFCSHSGDFLLIYPELFNYDWWDGGAWGTGWRADRKSGIKWQKEWGRERRKEGRVEDEEGGGGDGVGGILWNRRIIEL